MKGAIRGLDYSTYAGFLTRRESERLHELAELFTEQSAWTAGRQGSGYQKRAIKHLYPSLEDRALWMLGVEAPPHPRYDCWLIRYPEGSSAPPHRDPAPRT